MYYSGFVELAFLLTPSRCGTSQSKLSSISTASDLAQHTTCACLSCVVASMYLRLRAALHSRLFLELLCDSYMLC